MENFPRNTPQETIFNTFRDFDRLKELPKIIFPKNWEILLVPPFNGAAVRFGVYCKNGKFISVYLDVSQALGSMSYPYWEIYPNKDGDISRFEISDIPGLLAAIKKARKKQR